MSNEVEGSSIQRLGMRILPSTTREKLKLLGKRTKGITKQLFGNSMGTVGILILVAFMVMGAFGEEIAPYKVTAGETDQRFGRHMLPTDLAGTETVYAVAGESVEVTGVFEPRPGWPGMDPARYGLLNVTVEPEVPTTIYVDGTWRNMYSLDNLKISPTTHTVSFSDVPGYVTPSPITFDAKGNARVSKFSVEFVECGVLNVTTNPWVAEATVYVDGAPRGQGSLYANLAPGTYNVSFGKVAGYLPPQNETVTIAPGETVNLVGNYTVSAGDPGPAAGSGYLTVRVMPSLPTTVYLNNNWTGIGGFEALRLRPGNYSVSFSDIPGYITPDPQRIRIFANQTLEVNATFEEMALLVVNTSPYLPSTIYVNGAGRNDGSLNVYVPEGKYDVTFRSVKDYHVPVPDTPRIMADFMPWTAGALVTAGVVLVIRKSSNLPRRRLASLMAAAGLATSLAGLSWVGLGELGTLDNWSSPWLHPVSVVGVALGLCSLVVLQPVLDRRLMASFLLAALVPVSLLGSILVDLNPLVFSSFLMLLLVVAGLLAGISAGIMHGSVKRWALLQVSGGVDASSSHRIALTLKAFGSLAAALVVLAGILVYLVGHWTTHWMGTSSFGSDILSELLYGARTSIIVGIFSAVIASVLGALVGLYSGYAGGWKDEVIMRANDVVLSIPWLVLMIIVAALLQKIDLTGIILIIGLTGWSATARMVRAQVLSLRERQFIERARAIGSTDLGIIRRHILPNSFPLVFANTILTVAVSILSEATLSFLGMRPVGVVTWGTMLDYAQAANAFSIGLSAWIVAPGLCIVLIVLGFSLLGYVLDDILNPKLRRR